jgi:hypothetical protein
MLAPYIFVPFNPSYQRRLNISSGKAEALATPRANLSVHIIGLTRHIDA